MYVYIVLQLQVKIKTHNDAHAFLLLVFCVYMKIYLAQCIVDDDDDNNDNFVENRIYTYNLLL